MPAAARPALAGALHAASEVSPRIPALAREVTAGSVDPTTPPSADRMAEPRARLHAGAGAADHRRPAGGLPLRAALGQLRVLRGGAGRHAALAAHSRPRGQRLSARRVESLRPLLHGPAARRPFLGGGLRRRRRLGHPRSLAARRRGGRRASAAGGCGSTRCAVVYRYVVSVSLHDQLRRSTSCDTRRGVGRPRCGPPTGARASGSGRRRGTRRRAGRGRRLAAARSAAAGAALPGFYARTLRVLARRGLARGRGRPRASSPASPAAPWAPTLAQLTGAYERVRFGGAALAPAGAAVDAALADLALAVRVKGH